jgi:carboxymethylenebutenolidase
MANAGADFGAVFDAHVKAEFVDLDVDAAMATMTPNPYLTHLPADTVTEEVSRTIGEDRLVDEMILRFTHDIEMDGILPGVAPTGRFVEMVLAVVVDFEDGKVSAERISWVR